MTRGDGSNLTEEQIHVIKFAAAVIDAYGKGRRQSQAAQDLRAILPTERPRDYSTIHDHVTSGDEDTS